MAHYDTNLAAEFHVLSVLQRLGHNASLTLGNKKAVDIFVAPPSGGTVTIGRHYYGTNKGREILRSALEGAELVCVTEADRVPAGKLRHPPIDHIALSTGLASRASVVEAWEGTTADGVKLSDHCGLVVVV